MNRKEFEDKYLKHNFFWIENKKQAQKVQEIFIEFGFFYYTNKLGLIAWHKGFNSLVTFQPDKQHKNKYFQKGGFYRLNYSYGQPIDYQNFIKDYNDLKINENKMKEVNDVATGRWEYLKTGSVYRVIDIAENTTNINSGQMMVLYQRNGLMFVKESNEFLSEFIKRNDRRDIALSTK